MSDFQIFPLFHEPLDSVSFGFPSQSIVLFHDLKEMRMTDVIFGDFNEWLENSRIRIIILSLHTTVAANQFEFSILEYFSVSRLEGVENDHCNFWRLQRMVGQNHSIRITMLFLQIGAKVNLFGFVGILSSFICYESYEWPL